jgi:hypothetical protein
MFNCGNKCGMDSFLAYFYHSLDFQTPENYGMSWSDNLAPNSPAYEIAASTSPSLRVIAGPGTGKSFAMKRRVARLLEAEVPEQRHALQASA